MLQVMREEKAVPRGQEFRSVSDLREGKMLEKNRMPKKATFD